MRTIAATHGRRQVNEYEVEITRDMRDRALAFAYKIVVNGDQFSRLLPEDLRDRTPENIIRILKVEVQRTYVGKLAELAFLEYLHEKDIPYEPGDMFTIYPGQANADPYDFITANDMKIDVKAGYRQNHVRLLVNRDQFENSPKDYYVGVKLNAEDEPDDDLLIKLDSVQSAVIKGYAERAYLENVNYRNFGESDAKHTYYNSLLGIDELLQLF